MVRRCRCHGNVDPLAGMAQVPQEIYEGSALGCDDVILLCSSALRLHLDC